MPASDRSRNFVVIVGRREAAREGEARANALERLATSFLSAAGYDQAGEPVEGDDRGVLEPLAGLGWLGIGDDLRAVAEEHLTGRQLEAARLAADGYGISEIGRRLGIDHTSARDRLRGAGRKLAKKYPQHCHSSRGNDNEGPYGGADHSVLAENAVLCGPRSPESDPERVRCVPFFPANDRRDLYWTTLPRNPRDIMFEPALARGADDEWSDVVAMRPVPDFYPDPGIQDVDSRRVLLSTFGERPIVTVQADGESTGKHAARHKRRVEAWLALDENRPRLPVKARPSSPRARLLPNIG